MSARADLLTSAKQYPRHCFADISVDHHELGRWQYRNELRRQDASPLLPVVDANVLTEWLGASIGYEIGRKARKFFCEIVRHSHFPVLFGASRIAQHNATTVCSARASEHSSLVRENFASHNSAVPQRNRFATGVRA